MFFAKKVVPVFLLLSIIMLSLFSIGSTRAFSARSKNNGYQSYHFNEFGFSVKLPSRWKASQPGPNYGSDAVALFTKPGNYPARHAPKLILRRKHLPNVSDNFGTYQSDEILTYEGEHPSAQTFLDENHQRFLLVSNNKKDVSNPNDAMADIQAVYVGTNDVITLDFDLPFPTYKQIEKEVYSIAENIAFQEGYGPIVNTHSSTSEIIDEETLSWLDIILNLLGAVLQIGFFVFLLIIGYFVGKLEEKKHFKKIRYREQQTAHQPVITSRLKYALSPNDQEKVASCTLVCGSMVVSEDYFKRIMAGLKCFFGGQIASFETLLDRARREAILRMKEQQPHADMYINVRTETSSVGQGFGKNDVSSIEALAYGTAIFFKDGQNPLQHRQKIVESNAESSFSETPQ